MFFFWHIFSVDVILFLMHSIFHIVYQSDISMFIFFSFLPLQMKIHAEVDGQSVVSTVHAL